MSDATPPTPDEPARARPPLYRVAVALSVEADSEDDAREVVRSMLHGAAARVGDDWRDSVRSWAIDDEEFLLAPFAGSGIPEIVAEMFPPEPHPDQYRLPDGSVDQDGFEDAHEQWRDECLSLAVTASRLPQLQERLERAERVRDGLQDVMERHTIAPRPDPLHFRHASDAGIDEDAYRRVLTEWEQDALTTLLMQNEALETLRESGGARTAYLPTQFHQEWLPADLLAVTTLRELLAQPVSVTGRLLGREQREQLSAMLLATDPDVSIPDPDTPNGMPIYEGAASEAHRWIIPGVYPATGLDGQGEFRVVVGRSPVGDTATASAAFAPAEHDSIVLSKIARILESIAGVDREVTDPLVSTADLHAALERIDTLIASTGRTGGGSETLIERGVLLSDLLAEREKNVTPETDGHSPRNDGDGLDLSR